MDFIKKEVSPLELKRLLFEINEKRPDVCVRFRLIGEMWTRHFMRIVVVYDGGVLFYDDATRMITRVARLENIMQFEIDNNFQNYQPHYHYDVVLDDHN
jgi:hypothetical protein